MNLDLDIKQNGGRWNLEKFDPHNSYSCITNNASEALNSKLKRLLEWKIKTEDMAILYLFNWQINAVQDIMSGFCNIEDLMLRKRYKHLEKNAEDVELDTRGNPRTRETSH